MKTQDYDPNAENQIGCILGEPNSTYHANPAISHSKLTEFMDRPALFKGRYLTGEIERKETEALVIGSAVHTLLLEGEEAFDDEYCATPDGLSFVGKVNKLEAVSALNETLFNPLPPEHLPRLATLKREEIEAHFENYPRRRMLTADQLKLINKCVDAVQAHPIASQLLAGGVPEVVFRSPETVHGYQVQCRADWLNVDGCGYTEGQSYGLDLKTIDDLAKWNKAFFQRGYYRAYPFYTKTMELTIGEAVTEQWFWIVVEKQYPYEVRVCSPSPEVYERGMEELGYAMPALANALHHQDFADPGKDKVCLQTLPDWLLDKPVNVGIPMTDAI